MMGKVKTPFEMVLHYERMLDQKDKRITELEKSLGIANGYLRKGVEIDDQLKAENKWLRERLDEALTCALDADPIRKVFEYANTQADSAQLRLLQDKALYDDRYWQPVLDRLRYELLQILEEKK